MRSFFVGSFSLLAIGLLVTWTPACGSDNGADGSSGGNGDGGVCEGFGCPQDGDGGPKPGCVGLECQQVVCEGSGKTTVSGTVFDPAGKVPVYNVTVYVPNADLAPIAEGASCNRCDAAVSGNPVVITATDTEGKFTLENVPVGKDIPLVMQIGKWRRKVTIPAVDRCVSTPLDAGVTRLPRNRSEGDIPRIAVSTGAADPLQCLLRKIGLDESEFGTTGSDARIHLFQGGGFDQNGSPKAASGSFAGGQAFAKSDTLWSSADALKTYDVVLLACEGTDEGANVKPDPAKIALYDYAKAGGRVFASHYHHQWFSLFPKATDPAVSTVATWATTPGANITPGENIPPGAPTPATTPVDAQISGTFPKAVAMKEWLSKQDALPGGNLPLLDARHNVDAVSGGALEWISLSNAQALPTAGTKAVQYMTFNTPLGAADDAVCGRVVFSNLHVGAGSEGAATDDATAPFPTSCATQNLSAQQKALEFMLFDLSSCVQRDDKDITPPR